MKVKVTVFLLALFIFSAQLYPQSASRVPQDINAGVKTPQVIRVDDLSKSAGTPQEPANYTPGHYYEESFEGASFPPPGWQTVDISGNYTKWTKEQNTASQGIYSAVIYSDKYFNPWEGGEGLDWLITPQLTIAAGDSLKFDFFSYYSSGSGSIAVVVSENETIATDSASLASAFTDTLMVLDNANSPNQVFNEHSASLSKYAGKKIYLAFKALNFGGCKSGIDMVRIGTKEAKDAAAYSIDLKKIYKVGESIDIQGTFKNYGTEFMDSVKIKFEILETGKQYTWTLDRLYFGLYSVMMNRWKTSAADVGSYTAKITVSHPDDKNPGNDTLTQKFAIVPNDFDAKWFVETPMPKTFQLLSAASYTKYSGVEGIPDTAFIFAIGGKNGDSTYSKIYKYNTLSRVWAEAGSLPTGLSDGKAVTVGNKIYVLSGLFRETSGYGYSVDSLFIFNPETGAVTTGAKCPSPIMNYAAGVYGDSLIYTFGGGGFMSAINSVYVYNVNTNTWSEAAPLPGDGRTSLAGSICGNKIVVAGGRTSNDVVSTVNIGVIDPADPTNISWTTEEYPGGKFQLMSAGSWYGKEKKYVLFTGGADKYGYNPIKGSWAYDVEHNTWVGAPDQIYEKCSASDMVPVTRNDSVYMALLGGVNLASMTLSDNAWLYVGPSDKGLMKTDVAAYSIDFDSAAVGVSMTPKATVVNKRLADAGSFDVTMRITPGDYVSTKTVSALAAKMSTQVQFAQWVPSEETEYTVKVYTSLNGDPDKTNDTLTSKVISLASDVMIEQFYMESAVRVQTETSPMAVIYNSKEQHETFKVTLKITPGNYSCEKTITNMGGWAYEFVEFDKWTPSEVGNYDVKVYTNLASDNQKENDTIALKVSVMKGIETGEWMSDNGPFHSTTAPSVFYTKKAANKTEADSGFIFIANSRMSNSGPKKIGSVDSSFTYNVVSGIWKEAPTIPVPLFHYKPAYAAGKIYVPGGYTESEDDFGVVNSLYIYDIASNKWSLGAPMPKPAAAYSIGVYGDSLIYVIGGAYEGLDTMIVYKGAQIYNVNSNTWKEGTEYSESLPIEVSGTILKNKIVLMGGQEPGDIYDNRTAKLKSSEQSIAMIRDLSDKVYVGEINPADPYSITWTVSVNPAGESSRSAASAYETKDGGYVLFAGGITYNNDYSSSVFVYDVFKNEWFMAPGLPVSVEGACGVTAVRNDSVYFAVIGGDTDDYEYGLIQWVYLGKADSDSGVGVIDKENMPLTYSLSQNYPNPFNPSTVIKYSVADAGQVELKVYNILGQEVITLVNEFMKAGQHEVKFNAAGLNLSSGVYLYRIKAGSFVQTKKLMLIK